MPMCGSWVSGSVDWQVWSSGFCGFFFGRYDWCLEEEVGMAEVGCGSLKSGVVGFVGCRRSSMFGSRLFHHLARNEGSGGSCSWMRGKN